MRYYAVFDAIGVITQIGYYDDETFSAIGLLRNDMLEIANPGQVNLHDFMASHYVAGGHLQSRLQITPMVDKGAFAASGSDLVTITGLPVPCVARTSGVVIAGPIEVTDGVLEITSDQPGDITVAVTADPMWLPWSATVHAT